VIPRRFKKYPNEQLKFRSVKKSIFEKNNTKKLGLPVQEAHSYRATTRVF